MGSADRSRRYHNRVAGRYDRIYDDPYWELHDELTWRAIKPYLPHDFPSPCVDLGCGTGKWGLRLLKTGLPTTFVDHSPNMIVQTRQKVEALGPKAKGATLLVADIVDLSALPSGHFALALAMGDPLSICSDPPAAVREMARVSRSGGIIIATADNKLAALEHFVDRGDLDALEDFVRAGRTHWLTAEKQEQFDLRTFTPAELRRLFEKSGLKVLDLSGKTILPLRRNRRLLERANAVDRLLRLEAQLAKDPAAAACASHLQIVARKMS